MRLAARSSLPRRALSTKSEVGASLPLAPMPERDLFANFERMRREIDELFGDVFERSGFAPRRGFQPRVDVYYCGSPPDRAIVKAEIAGVDIGEVDVEIRGRQLVLTGVRRPQESEGRIYQQ